MGDRKGFPSSQGGGVPRTEPCKGVITSQGQIHIPPRSRGPKAIHSSTARNAAVQGARRLEADPREHSGPVGMSLGGYVLLQAGHIVGCSDVPPRRLPALLTPHFIPSDCSVVEDFYFSRLLKRLLRSGPSGAFLVAGKMNTNWK